MKLKQKSRFLTEELSFSQSYKFVWLTELDGKFARGNLSPPCEITNCIESKPISKPNPIETNELKWLLLAKIQWAMTNDRTFRLSSSSLPYTHAQKEKRFTIMREFNSIAWILLVPWCLKRKKEIILNIQSKQTTAGSLFSYYIHPKQ